MSEKYPICPLCESEANTIFTSIDGDILGCENCVTEKDAWQWMADNEPYKYDPNEDYERLMRLATS